MRQFHYLFPFLPLLAACVDSSEPTAGAASTLACPLQLSARSKLPPESRVLGTVSTALTLWEAAVASGPPQDVGNERTLNPEERDDEDGATSLAGGGFLTRYSLTPRGNDIPGELEEYMLACRYGADARAALGDGPDSVMLLIPLPYASTTQCDIIEGPPLPGNRASPLVSASCQDQLAPAQPASARAFLEQVYSRYQSTEKDLDTLGKDAPELFAPELLALIREDQRLAKAKAEAGLLDHDPICACRDWAALALQDLSVVATGKDTAVAKVTLLTGGQQATVGFRLRSEDGQWRIENLSDPSVQYISVQRYLQDGLRDLRVSQGQ